MNKKIKSRLSLITVVWALLTVLLAYLPRWTLMDGQFGSLGINHGLVAHFVAYSVLAFLLSQLFVQTVNNATQIASQIASVSWLVTVAFASLVELGQTFLPYRTFDVKDILFNLFAAIIGSLTWRIYHYFNF